MDDFERKDFSKILKRGALEGHRWMRSTDSSAVRVYDRNLQSFPITAEFYGPYVRAVDYSDGGMSDDEKAEAVDIMSRYLYTEHDRIIWKERKKREGREQHEREDESLRLDVKENGLTFETEMLSYTDTGLFLDHAVTRQRVREMARGMRVLNLFSYTGSFSVYAAAGGAECVVSVDLSNVYCAWARRNLEKNGFLDEKKYSVVASDALSYLDEAYKRGERYDIVIFDPPAFSNSHKAEDFDVQKDYLGYLYRISRILADGGVVVFSENLQGFRFGKSILKPYWNTQEITGEVHAPGFSAKRSGLRVWVLKKTADMKEMKYEAADRKRRRMDEEKAERLSFGETAAPAEEKQGETASGAAEETGSERRDERRPRGRNSGYGERRERGGYRSRDDRREMRDRGSYRYRDDRRSSGYRDRGYDRPRYEDDGYRRGDDRPRYRDDYRPRESYRDRDRDYYGDRSGYQDRDRYDRRDSRDRRPYGDKESYRQRDNWPGRQDREDGYRPRRDRDWDNDTGRFYRGDRGGRRDGGYRSPRYSETGEDRRPFGDSRGGDRRRRNSPKPYGYDSFMVTKNRDTADVEWLKNTEIRSDDEN